MYLFVIEGMLTLGDITLSTRDAAEIKEADDLVLVAKLATSFLLIEVPLEKA